MSKRPTAHPHHTPRTATAITLWILASVLLIAAILSSLLLILDKAWVHHSLSIYPNYQKLAAVTSTSQQQQQQQPSSTSLHTAKFALVSLQEGFKYHGSSLGKFLRCNKLSYANLHGYAYTDIFPNTKEDEELLLTPLNPWMESDEHGAMYYKKLRMLLLLMEKYDNLEWLLWVDGDAIVTQPHVSIEDRVEEFTKLHHIEKESHTTGMNDGTRGVTHPLALVWVKDSTMPNAGVMLIRNSPPAREYIRKALGTLEDGELFRSFTDQASLMESTLLLQHGHGSTLLQSRVRGPTSGLWKPGHWILHLPDHNYLELLSSLQRVGKELATSPPPLFPPLGRPSMESLSKARRDRFESVQGAIRHAWRGYADVCLHGHDDSTAAAANSKRFLGSHIPCDDLSPLATSGSRGHDWLYHAATLHDSIDTLAIAFGTDSSEYKEALDMILSRDLQATALRPTKTFEYSLRIVGGLLGAFSVTGDARLLSRARDAADALLQSPFASSPTILPRMFDVLYPPRGGGCTRTLYKIYSRMYQWGRDVFTSEHHYNSLAGVGSFSLEFYFLSDTLGLPEYRQVVDDIFKHVAKYQGRDGTVPNSWNVMTGEPTTTNGGLGSGSDSFVEYLLKVPLLVCGRGTGGDIPSTSCGQDHPVAHEMLDLYYKIVSSSLRSKHTIRKEGDVSIVYPADGSSYHQLLCFLPGLVALETYTSTAVDGESDFLLAEAMLQGCHDMYKKTPTGFGPEEVHINQKSHPPLGDRQYLLRPEYVESLFVLYRVTGREEYQEMGWEVFESLEHYCRTEWGYTGLKDVYDAIGVERIDDMPSYFIAETLKYLLLLFGPDDFLSLEEFVFTTEAHPMRRKQGKGTTTAHHYIQAELSGGRFEVHNPLPWTIFGAFVLVTIVLRTIIFLLQKSVGAATNHHQSNLPRHHMS
eukprot:CAMPEP_0172305146 /NCGR_PEP_ID=MMETSP1058-20130122/6471_1 /TAXON_ID=83371 /ORGANISM="Detonula confervacea, Strain CCMP 353" /LENGTH=922 /DNA_ID=CAMNT_0013016637 /DNA_START=347 /DNA_END=3115 /DNA_ORIENTATION=-